MSVFEILLLSLGLAADAFALALGNGLAMPKMTMRKALQIAVCFGMAQGLMPLLGFVVGDAAAKALVRFSGPIALVFLTIIGGKMIVGGIKEHLIEEGKAKDVPHALTWRALLLQSIANSIDALVVGLNFALLGFSKLELGLSALIIAVITFALSLLGVFAGKRFGARLGSKAEIAGGVVLVVIGVKLCFF